MNWLLFGSFCYKSGSVNQEHYNYLGTKNHNSKMLKNFTSTVILGSDLFVEDYMTATTSKQLSFVPHTDDKKSANTKILITLIGQIGSYLELFVTVTRWET